MLFLRLPGCRDAANSDFLTPERQPDDDSGCAVLGIPVWDGPGNRVNGGNDARHRGRPGWLSGLSAWRRTPTQLAEREACC